MAKTNDDDSTRVLVVEDDPGLADLYVHWLQDSYTVEVANDCAGAYWEFNKRIDVMLLDRHLPDGTGDEILRNVRDLGIDCSVAMVTAERPTIDLLELEFDEYLSKPVSGDELEATVDRLVALRDFRSAISELGMLIRKKQLVETHCSSDELEESDEYAALLERLNGLKDEFDEMEDLLSTMSFDTDMESVYSD